MPIGTTACSVMLGLAIACTSPAPCEGQATPDDLPTAAVLASDTSDTAELLRELRRLRDTAGPRFDSLSTILTITVQMHLGKLGFQPGPFTGEIGTDTRAAIRRFEEARGLSTTGNLFTLATLSALRAEMDRVETLERAPGPNLPTFGDALWSQGYATVEGEWLSSPMESASQDAVRIECVRDTWSCDILYARLGRGGTHRLWADKEAYQIASWDRAEIVSRPLDYPCARYFLRINRVQKTATLVRSTLSTTGSCSHMTPADITTHLATWEESNERHRRLQHEVLSLYAFEGRARALVAPTDSAR